MSWRILVNVIRQSMLKLKTHSFSGFHDLFLKHPVVTTSSLYFIYYVYGQPT